MNSLLCAIIPFICSLTSPAGPPAESRLAIVSSVTDGDTIRVIYYDAQDEGSQPVRLIGVNAPEYNIYRRIGECYGKQSADALSLAVNQQTVLVELDRDPTDRYRRTLAYIWVGDHLINEQLARDGFARTMTIRPNIRYADRFYAAEAQAKVERRGVWGGCS